MNNITLTINGIKRTVEFEGHEMLLDILRDKLDLTGAKRGCDTGTCGACVVVVNGEARTSCNLLFRMLDGAEILTIEGLSKGKQLHIIQRAFIKADAIQCGFCIPGIIMRLYVLFNKNPNASDEEIKKALSHHLCRCTGYTPIFEAAKIAQEYIINEKES